MKIEVYNALEVLQTAFPMATICKFNQETQFTIRTNDYKITEPGFVFLIETNGRTADVVVVCAPQNKIYIDTAIPLKSKHIFLEGYHYTDNCKVMLCHIGFVSGYDPCFVMMIQLKSYEDKYLQCV